MRFSHILFCFFGYFLTFTIPNNAVIVLSYSKSLHEMRHEITLTSDEGYSSTNELKSIIKKLKYPKDRFHDICYFGSLSVVEALGLEDSFLNDLSIDNIRGVITSLVRNYRLNENYELKNDIKDRIEDLEAYLLTERNFKVENWVDKKERRDIIRDRAISASIERERLKRIGKSYNDNVRVKKASGSFLSFFLSDKRKKKQKRKRGDSLISLFFGRQTIFSGKKKVHPATVRANSLKYLVDANERAHEKFEKTHALPKSHSYNDFIKGNAGAPLPVNRSKSNDVFLAPTRTAPPPSFGFSRSLDGTSSSKDNVTNYFDNSKHPIKEKMPFLTLYKKPIFSVVDALYEINKKEVEFCKANEFLLRMMYAELAENLLKVMRLLATPPPPPPSSIPKQ